MLLLTLFLLSDMNNEFTVVKNKKKFLATEIVHMFTFNTLHLYSYKHGATISNKITSEENTQCLGYNENHYAYLYIKLSNLEGTKIICNENISTVYRLYKIIVYESMHICIAQLNIYD